MGVGLIAWLVSCSSKLESKTDSVTDPQPDRSKLASSMKDLVDVAEGSVAVLGTLPPEQQRAITDLIQLVEALAVVGSRGPSEQQKLAAESISKIAFPRKGVSLASVFGSCRDESIAYRSAAEKCKDDGKQEHECPASWGAAQAEINCYWNALEKLRRRLGGIPGPGGGPTPPPLGP